MKLSTYVIDFLASQGATHIFEVCGGALAHLLDSLYAREDVCTVSMHHEMAAAIAAEGYSRAGGNVGVAMATSGPGATNMITGIGSCYFDSVPCLFITGQVNTYEFKFDQPVRQVGFQETDIVKIVKPIVKDAVLITKEDDIQYHLERAFHLAMEGRPGPVLLDIPMNVQRAEVEPRSLKAFDDSGAEPKVPGEDSMREVLELMKRSDRPMMLVGGGVRTAKATTELMELVQKTGIPVVTSLMGLDAFPHDHPCFMGMIGTYGNRYANLAVANSDLLLALGTRLDTRQTGTRPETFARGAKIVQVDIDPNELEAKVPVHLAVPCHLQVFLKSLNSLGPEVDQAKVDAWRKVIGGYKASHPSFIPSKNRIDPNHFMHQLSGHLPKDAMICTDVGQIQMWAAQSLEIRGTQRFLTQGGMACMGSALPLAIGASFARPGRMAVVIAGDGGFQLNTQELQTVYHHRLPVKVILLNNECYGMVRQFQEQYFEGRLQSTVQGYSAPNFPSVVQAYRIPAKSISASSEVEAAFRWLFQDMSPRFLEVVIGNDSKVTPKLSVNKPIEDQDPPLDREELRSKMFLEILEETEGLN